MINQANNVIAKYAKPLTWVVLGVLLICLVYMRVVSHFITRFPLILNYPDPTHWLWWMYRGRYGVLLVVGLGLVLLCWTEIRAQVFSKFLLGQVQQSRWRAVALLVGMTVLGRSYLLRPALLAIRHDGIAIASNSWGYKLAFSEGVFFPQWNNYIGFGNPWGQFHFSLTYWLIGFYNFLFEPFTSVNMFLLSCHIAMTVVMFVCIKYLLGRTDAALFGALIWAGTFYHYYQFVGLAGYTQVLNWISVPLILVLYEKIADQKLHLLPVLALVLIAQFWIHQIYGMWILLMSFVYAVIRLGAIPEFRTNKILGLLVLGVIHVVGILGATNQIIPVLLEGELVAISGLVGDEQEALRFPWLLYLQDVFTPRGVAVGTSYPPAGGYINPLLFMLGIVGSVALFLKKQWQLSALPLWFLIGVTLTFGATYVPFFDAFIDLLPGGQLIYSIKAPGRYVFIFDAFMVILAALGAVYIGEQLQKRWPQLSVASVVVLLGVVLAVEGIGQTTRFDHMYPQAWNGIRIDTAETFAEIATQEKRNQRVYIYDGEIAGMQTTYFTGLGGMNSHPEEDLPNQIYIQHIEESLSADPTAFADDNLQKIAYLFDIGHFVVRDIAQEGRHPRHNVVHIEAHTPITGSCALQPLADVEELQLSTLDLYSYNAALNMVDALPAFTTGEAKCTGAEAAVSLTDYTLAFESVSMTIDADAPMYVQLAQSYYPFLKVYIDGVAVDYFQTGVGLIGLEVSEGLQTITVEPYLNAMRRWNLGLNAGLMLALVFMYLRMKRRYAHT